MPTHLAGYTTMVDPITGTSPSRDSIWRQPTASTHPVGPLVSPRKARNHRYPGEFALCDKIFRRILASLLGRCLVGAVGRARWINFRWVMNA